MKSMNEVLAADSSHKEWIPLLELATREVFEMMLGCKLAAQSEIAVDGSFDITGMVGLAGQMCGVLTVRCTAKSATLMASKMLGMEPAEGSQDVLDALGEICNMVAGNFKNKVAGMGDGCMLSVPTVITGKDYSLHSLADSGTLEVGLLFENMPIAITLQIHS
jgi:chemotaxis protein CheX